MTKARSAPIEIGTVICLLEMVPDIAGRTTTAYALLTQRALTRYLLGCGADYLFTVKGNQSNPLDDILLTLDEAIARGSLREHRVPPHAYPRDTTRLLARGAVPSSGSDGPPLCTFPTSLRLFNPASAGAARAIARAVRESILREFD